MPAPMYTDESDLAGVYLLQRLAVADRNEPVLCAMNDVSMTLYFCYPEVSAQMKAKYQADREYRKKPFNHP